MKQSEQEHFDKNLTILLKKIKATKEFLSYFIGNEIITDDEEESVLAEKTNVEKVSTLYSILKTRNSYEILITALEETRQKEAAEILKQIHQKNQESQSEPVPSGSVTRVTSQGKMSDVSEMIVGSEECQIGKIVSLLEGHADIGQLDTDWRKLARKLNVQPPKIAKLERRQNMNQVSGADILEELLNDWVMTESSSATLEVLCQHFIDLKWNKFSEILIKERNRL